MSDVEAVRALMEIDRDIERVRARTTHLPESTELHTVETTLRALLQDLRANEARVVPLREEYERVAAEGARLHQRLEDVKERLASSTANVRELTALQSEVEHLSALVAESDDAELGLLESLEPLEKSLADIRVAAQPLMSRRTDLQTSVAALTASLDDDIAVLRVERARRAGEVSPAVLTRYEAALARAGTSGAAQVIDGRCDGCRLALAPLDVDRWRASTTSFMECPECSRLLLP